MICSLCSFNEEGLTSQMLVDVLVHSLSTGTFEEAEQRRVVRLVGRLGVALY
jgi:hypothetical protein